MRPISRVSLHTLMSKFEEYRRNAQEAQRQADRPKTEESRAAWLQLTVIPTPGDYVLARQ